MTFMSPLLIFKIFFSVITSIKTATKTVLESPGSSDTHKKLHDRCDLLLKCVSKVRRALEGDDLPSLLSDAPQHIARLGLGRCHWVNNFYKCIFLLVILLIFKFKCHPLHE